MGNVLLDYDPEVCLRKFLDREEDRAVIRRELFEGPQWQEGDLGYIRDAERFGPVSERVPERLHTALQHCVLEWMMCMHPVRGARAFCDKAKENGYRLYVLSNASDAFYDYFPRFAPLSYFDGVVVSCDIHKIKPGREIYEYLFCTYSLLPEECFFIDDREENIAAGKALGMDGFVFRGDFAPVWEAIRNVPGEKETVREQIRGQLSDLAEEKYREFNRSLIPGDTAPMIGVRMPKLREIAKKIARECPEAYLKEIREAEQRKDLWHEEYLLHGMVIGYLKCTVEERMRLLDEFVPHIRNWAVCDCSCMTYKFMKKETDVWFPYLLKFLQTGEEYQIRFAVVAMLDHFVTEAYIGQILEQAGRIRHDGYYVKMAVAWAVSVCFVKFPEQTKAFLADNPMDDFTQNKAIQKIRESYRVSKEEKAWILQWKR